MHIVSAPYEDLWQYLDNDTQIITVNSRLAQHLTKAFINYLKEKKHQFIINERIITVEQFFEQLVDSINFSEAKSNKYYFFYNAKQTQQLWQTIIEADQMNKKDDVFLDVIDAAKEASTAYELYLNWMVDLKNLPYQLEHLDFRRFQNWLAEVEKHCNYHKVYPDNSKLAFIIKHLKLTRFPFRRLIFLGFNDYSPNMNQLITRLESFDIDVFQWQLEPLYKAINRPIKTISSKMAKAETTLYQFDQTEDELSTTIDKIFEHFYTYPNQRIGVIIPDLHIIRHKVEQIFDECFFSNYNRLAEINNTDKPYTISGGQALAAVPIIKTALTILKLTTTSKLENLIRIIQSPFTYTKTSSPDRRQQLVDLIKANYFKTTSVISIRADIKLADALNEFKTPLEKLTHQALEYHSNPLLSIQTKLALFNFPGDQSLSSENYQALEQFYQLFAELKKQSILINQTNAIDIISLLERFASQTIFQGQSNPNASIFVLGILESSQHYFDQLYVMRMHERLWPAQPKPNTLLPLSLQKIYHTPHSSFERELYYAFNVSHAFFYQCKKLYISYSLFDGEMKQNLSPIIANLAPNNQIVEITSSKIEHKRTKSIQFKEETLSLKKLEQITDANSYLYKDFIQCPFKAQMTYRFKLEPLIQFKDPLAAKDKGSLIHLVMELFWQEIKTQKTLQELTEPTLQSIVQKAIKQAINKNKHLFPLALDYLKQIESDRIEVLVLRWLKIEKQRQVPFHVLSHEKSSQKQIGLLKTKLRIDRIDQLSDGSLWLIDYKSAQTVNTKGWHNEYLSEPQLPLYAISLDYTTGIGFAQINGKSTKLSLLAHYQQHLEHYEIISQPDTDTILQKPKKLFPSYDSWQSLTRYWHKQLFTISNLFTQGQLSITPNQQCKFCAFEQLCHYQHFKRGTN
ncbi:PD-(D/E)XK nuclease family protein [Thiotrichales bacterium 19S3-7]|nr:PD-(D/E)XK nuclease family protein [Thiotrichales bacterium 19S3-7]MCF6802880.1 PD-(D/E)XK nuclease family protein [Thiotrichales bacterium 19S3-11]